MLLFDNFVSLGQTSHSLSLLRLPGRALLFCCMNPPVFLQFHFGVVLAPGREVLQVSFCLRMPDLFTPTGEPGPSGPVAPALGGLLLLPALLTFTGFLVSVPMLSLPQAVEGHGWSYKHIVVGRELIHLYLFLSFIALRSSYVVI